MHTQEAMPPGRQAPDQRAASSSVTMINKSHMASFIEQQAKGFPLRLRAAQEALEIPGSLWSATLKGATPAIRKSRIFEMFQAGESFGLCGTPGVGKSGFFAGLVHDMLIRSWSAEGAAIFKQTPEGIVQVSGYRAILPNIFWLDWPSLSTRIRETLSAKRFDDPNASLSALIAEIRACDDPIVILDDIGRERVPEQMNVATEQLLMLIDMAYNKRDLRLYWTSNLGASELSKVYRDAFTSRLIGKAPEAILPTTLPDRRRT